MFFNIHNGDDPLLNFEFVKSAKLFFFPLFYFGWMHSRQRGLAVSDPAYEYEGSVVRIPATTRKNTELFLCFWQDVVSWILVLEFF